jgi:hypothetical protein
VKTIEQLQRIVSDENRTEQERKTAAEHILKLQNSSQEPAPAAESADEQTIRRIFADMFGWDRAEEQKREEDRTLHVCTSCFLLQPRANAICELCGGSEEWLLPSESRNNVEVDMFMRMAAGHSIEQFRIALQSGWAKTPQRERVARLLLASKESKLNPRTKVETAERIAEESEPMDVQEIDFDAILKHYDHQIAEISRQQPN